MNVLELRHVKKRLVGIDVLTNADLQCRDAETVVVMGPNGSGKSTLLKMLVGLIEPDAGSITLNGESLLRGRTSLRRMVGYLPDSTDVLPDLSVEEFVSLVQSLKAVGPAPEFIDHWRSTLGLGAAWKQRLRTLSFGQRKRAVLITALLGNPWLLVMDEPTNGLDGPASSLIEALIADRSRQNQLTVVSTNDLAFSERLNATRYRISNGELLP